MKLIQLSFFIYIVSNVEPVVNGRYVKQLKSEETKYKRLAPKTFIIAAYTSNSRESPDDSITISESNKYNEIRKLSAKLLPLISRESRSTTQHKQLFGGKLPPFIERIIQRVQNYFSVYNPPQFFEQNRPPVPDFQQDTAAAPVTGGCAPEQPTKPSCQETTAIIDNTSHETDFQEAFDECDQNEINPPTTEECNEQNGDNCDGDSVDANNSDQGIAVTSLSFAEPSLTISQTVVQDSLVNIYSSGPQNITDETLANKLIIILEQASPAGTTGTCAQSAQNKENNCKPAPNKFHVFTENAIVNDTFDEMSTIAIPPLGTKIHSQPDENNNVHYSVIINSNRVEEYTDNLKGDKEENEITSCEQSNDLLAQERTASSSNETLKSAIPNGCSKFKNSATAAGTDQRNATVNSVPNINLVLVPFDVYQKNHTCFKFKKPVKVIDNDSEMEYYILKPDPGPKKNLPKPINNNRQVPSLSLLHLPSDANTENYQNSNTTSVVITPTTNKYPILSKFPVLYRIINKIQDQPRS